MTDQWSAVLARIGSPTGDGRIIAPGALTNRDLPLPLMWQRQTGAGHEGAVVVGTIESVAIDNERGMVTGSGRLLDVRGSAEAQAQIEAGVTSPSVDIFDDVDIQEVKKLIEAGVVGPDLVNGLDDIEYSMSDDGLIVITRGRIAGATLVAIPAFAGVSITLETCDPATEDCSPISNYALTASVRSSGWSELPLADESRAWDGDAAAGRVFTWATEGGTTDWSRYARAFLRKDDGEDPETRGAYGFGIADVIGGELTIVPRGVFAAAAAVQGARTGSTPKDADAMKRVLRGVYARMDREPPFSLVASAVTSLPPLAWFAQPDVDRVTPLTVSDTGRIFGHVAPWGECHVGLPGCVTAPSSPSQYAFFHQGVQPTREGRKVPVGTLTVGGGHATADLAWRPALEHYDNVGTAVAKVVAGEDEFGIWVAGWMLPEATEEQVRVFESSPISGDWRWIGGNLEMIALCSVNSGGFPVPRARVSFSYGVGQRSLVACFGIKPRRLEVSGGMESKARWAWATAEG